MKHLLVGSPPDHMGDLEKSIWYEILDCLPLGTVIMADRIGLELLCGMYAEYRRDPNGATWDDMELLIEISRKFFIKPEDNQRLMMGEVL
jgi:hypothetical protein